MTTVEKLLEQKTAQLAAVREISRVIAEAKDLDSTLDLITRRTSEVMQVDSCSIYLYDKSREKLVLAASTGLNRRGIGRISLPYGAGLTGWAAEHRKLVAVADAFDDERFYRVIGSGESRFHSLMAMPLISQNKVIGAANVQTINRRQFTEEEIELFGFIFELAAVALEKAQLVHMAAVQEMHHRVKNNLQTIAMLLRLQISHKNLTPYDILKETINRVLSIATVHDILSETGSKRISVLDLIERLVSAISTNMLNPEANIQILVRGDDVELPAQRASSLALVANELLQNALEHGMVEQMQGTIEINLKLVNNSLQLSVADNGRGLPTGFTSGNFGLGLQIVQASIIEDMSGEFTLQLAETGQGTVAFVKMPLS